MRFSGIALAQACLANALDTTLSNNFAHQCKLREEEEVQQKQQRTSRSISLLLSSGPPPLSKLLRNEGTNERILPHAIIFTYFLSPSLTLSNLFFSFIHTVSVDYRRWRQAASARSTCKVVSISLDWSGQRLQSRALKGELETLDGYQSEQRHLGNTIKWTQTSDIFTLSKSFEIAEGGNANSKKCNITRVNPSGHGSTRYGSVRNRTMYIFPSIA